MSFCFKLKIPGCSMAREYKRVDISDMPEIVDLVAELLRTSEPRVLQANDEDVAILTPIRSDVPTRGRPKTPEDHEAFLASAGSWADAVDTERFKRENQERRRISTRPAVDL